MNYINDSEELQDFESICSEILSHVPSQPAVVQSPRAMSSRDQTLRLGTWNLSGTQGNVFGNPRAVLDSSQTPCQRILHSWNQSATGENSVRDSTGRPVSKSEEQIRGTMPLPSFARTPSTMNSFFPAEGPQNYMADQERLEISEPHVDKFPTSSTFSCWKIRFKTQVSSCSDFPSEAMLWIKDVEMVDSFEESKSSRSIQGYTNFPNFEMLDARIASALNKIIPNSYFKKRSVWRNRKLRKKIGSFADRLTWSPTTSELLALMIPFLITLMYSQSLFATTTFRNSIRDGMEFYYLWPRSHLMMFWKVCTNLRICEFDQLNTVSDLYDMEIHQKISMPNCQKLKTMVKKT